MSKSKTTDKEQQILKARALALAREPLQNEAEGERIEVVEFQLANERYAIESTYIGEVYPLKDLTRLPCTPSFVLGIINLRGRILSVIDLHTFFDLPNRGLSDLNKVIVLHEGAMEFGLLADAIVAARWIPRSTLQPSLPTLTEIRAEYLLGVTPERLVVLDGGKILADSHIVVHDEV
jgi:purine-binding chemotaxis protein CheW